MSKMIEDFIHKMNMKCQEMGKYNEFSIHYPQESDEPLFIEADHEIIFSFSEHSERDLIKNFMLIITQYLKNKRSFYDTLVQEAIECQLPFPR